MLFETCLILSGLGVDRVLQQSCFVFVQNLRSQFVHDVIIEKTSERLTEASCMHSHGQRATTFPTRVPRAVSFAIAAILWDIIQVVTTETECAILNSGICKLHIDASRYARSHSIFS